MTERIKEQLVVLCGCSSASLLPLARAGCSKRFLCLTGEESLFQQAVKRWMGLQKRRHQAGYCVVIKGMAEIISGDKKLLPTENQPTYIPLSEVRRWANPGNIPLEIIEVQSGSLQNGRCRLHPNSHYGRSKA